MQDRTTVAIRAILRGAFLGSVVSFIANSGTWHCLLREETLEELINREEPKIPENFMRNLSKQEIEERGEVLVLLRPWKVLEDLEIVSSPTNKHSIIFLWKVGVSNAKLRFIARATIGSISMINDKRIAVMFVTGFSNHRSLKLLSQENEQFGDILAFNVPVDAPAVDSQLVLAAFKWIAKHLSDLFELVVTTHNNELMPFIPTIVDFVEQGDISRDTIVCSAVKRPEPRPSDPRTTDYVKAFSYNSSYFPSHCRSDLVILKTEMMWKIQELGRKTITAEIPPEIYLWGVLREKLRRNGAKNIVNYEESMKQAQTHVMSYPLLYNHFEAVSQAKEMWDVMQEEFTSEHRDNKIQVTYRHQIISNNEKDNLISKESAQFIKKWSHHN